MVSKKSYGFLVAASMGREPVGERSALSRSACSGPVDR
jgi:hypothetical protein